MAERQSRWIATRSERRWLVLLTALLILLTVWLAVIGRPLETSAAPAGIVSYELAGTAARASEILGSWPAGAREAAMLSLGLDYLYLLVYPAWLYLACRAAGHGLGATWEAAACRFASAVGLAAPLDAVENLALIAQLRDGAADFPAALALVMAVPKFALVLGTGLFLLAALAYRVLLRMRA